MHKPTLAALATTLTLLAGCTSIDSVMEREPTFTAQTTKTPKAYANCVLERWSEKVPTSNIEREDGSFRVRNEIGGLADAAPAPGGTRVTLREAPMSGYGMEERARACL